MSAANCKNAYILDSLEKSATGKLVILKNNTPKAVLISFETHEALEEELEYLRLTTHAYARQNTFRSENARSHKDMMKKFG